MLLNLSNHPSASWSDKQSQEAKRLFGEIKDMPFPKVDPTADEEEIDRMANNYLKGIRALRPKAVHLMGELTFTLALVKLLQEQGITVLASTTHRSTADMPDGSKVARFEFVRFRKYAMP